LTGGCGASGTQPAARMARVEKPGTHASLAAGADGPGADGPGAEDPGAPAPLPGNRP
jgi:hypothetical protein